jgi:hypothetical protein
MSIIYSQSYTWKLTQPRVRSGQSPKSESEIVQIFLGNFLTGFWAYSPVLPGFALEDAPKSVENILLGFH